jgi:hypothetical protein
MNSFKYLLVTIALIYSYSGFSQEKEPEKRDSIIPQSIYAIPVFSTDINSTYYLNNRLNLTSYQFVRFNQSIFEEGNLAIPFYNITQSPSEYIYDSYVRNYETAVLQSAFFKVSDLYRPRTKNDY